MHKFTVMRGTALPLTIGLVDDQGATVRLLDADGQDPGLSGSDLLSAVVWPGGNRAAAFAVDCTWNDPIAGLVDVTVGDDQTSALDPGRYQGAVLLDHPTLGLITACRWSMEVLASAGAIQEPDPDAPPPPPVYCDLADVLEGRSWLRDLQDDDDEGGFARTIVRASRWLDDLIIGRAPRPFGGTNLGGPGSGALSAGLGSGPSPYLRRLLDGGGLAVRDWVVECVSKRAAYLILDGKIGPGADPNPYQALARRLKAESYNLATSRTAELRAGGPDSQPTIFVHLGSGSLR